MRTTHLRRCVLFCAISVVLSGLFAVGLHASVASPVSEEPPRVIAFDYEVEIPPSDGAGEAGESITLFLPVAANTTGQKIRSLKVESEYEGVFESGEKHGNRFWRVEVPSVRPASTQIAIRYEVERRVVRAGDRQGSAAEAAAFLEADARVAVAHPILDPILKEIRAANPNASDQERARGIYDWVVDNVEYKKVGTGWGNGDTFWACNERYGNCTDFHSLFISLARTEGIPARFEMGFPIPADRSEGTIGGYHCWVEFWVPEVGWIPIDASEAFKHPEKRSLFFGTHPADRIQFSTGRDLRLGSAHQGRTLNYFIYPYAERAGKRLGLELETRFRYRELGESS